MCKYSTDPALEFVITLFRLEAAWHFTLYEIPDKDDKRLHALATDSMISK
jgi:hypothetical protein